MTLIELLFVVIGVLTNSLVVQFFFAQASIGISIFSGFVLYLIEVFFLLRVYPVISLIKYGLPVAAIISNKKFIRSLRSNKGTIPLIVYLQHIKDINLKRFNEIRYFSSEKLLSEENLQELVNYFIGHNPYNKHVVSDTFFGKKRTFILTAICQLNLFFDFDRYDDGKKDLLLARLLAEVENNKQQFMTIFEEDYTRKNSLYINYCITMAVLIKVLVKSLNSRSLVAEQKKELINLLLKQYFCDFEDAEEETLYFSPPALERLILLRIQRLNG